VSISQDFSQTAVCMECVLESAWLAWCVHVSCHGSADFSLCWLCSGFCWRSLVACWGSCLCSVPCSGPRTERACSYPSPKGWYRARRVGSLDFCRRISAGPCGCCCICCVAWVVRSTCGNRLCAPQMWMICIVSMFPSVRLAAFVFPGRLRVRLRVGILRFARPCARGVICDASGPASRRVVAAPRCFVASCAGIRIISQGLAKPCISELSVLPQFEASLGGGV